MTEPATDGARTRTIRLPEEVARAIEERIRGTGFASVDAFVEFVLARLLEQPGEGVFSEEDERTLKERLRSLGYID
jgi:Arc/MetJ-type ribon-helix-helix transcriptional regulator